MKKGLTWCVGNGRSIRIWRDNWTPPHGTGRPITTQGQGHIQRVSEMPDDHGALQTDVLWYIFLLAGVQEILKIRTSTSMGDDFLVWAPEWKGLFIVWSVYQLALEERHRPCVVPASRAPNMWRAVWLYNGDALLLVRFAPLSGVLSLIACQLGLISITRT